MAVMTRSISRLAAPPAALLLLGLVLTSPALPVVAAADPDVVADPDLVIVLGPGEAPATSACADDRAVLIHVGDGVLRCEAGVPVPRPQPWNAGGCGQPLELRYKWLADARSVIVVRPDACLVAGRVAETRAIIEAGR
jgi:hypothetical protein